MISGLGLDSGKVTPQDCKECRIYQCDASEEKKKTWCKETCPGKVSIDTKQSQRLFNMLLEYHYRMLGGEQLKFSRPIHFAIGFLREKKNEMRMSRG